MSEDARHEPLWHWLAQHHVAHCEFAEAMGKSAPTVSNWLHLRGRPDIETLDKIARWTGLSIQTLVDGFLRRKCEEPSRVSASSNVTDLRVVRLKRRAANKNG